MCIYHIYFILNIHFRAWNITPNTPRVRFGIIFDQQEGQDGPGSLTRFFEIALANSFFLSLSEKKLQEFLCLYSARSLHSLIPCLLTDQNFKNNSEKGHPRNISMRLFQILTNGFRDFVGICLCSYSQVPPIHQSLAHCQVKRSLQEHFCELGIRSQ